jgi:NAD+ synthase (glutamine-hydrolysing)
MRFRIALAQINPTVGDIVSNRKRIEEYIYLADRKSADIVVFPELALCGYPPEDLLFKENFARDNLKELGTLAKTSCGLTAVVGFADTDDKGALYNAAAVINKGKVAGVYHKKELPNYAVFDEKRYFSPQKKNRIFSMGGVDFGVTICEDIWERKGPYLEQAASGADVIFNISGSPYHAGKVGERIKVLAPKARKTGCYICYVNLVGGQDELVFDGGSFVLDPRGRVISSAKQFEEGVVFAEIDIREKRKRRAVPGVQRTNLIPEKRFVPMPGISSVITPKLDLPEEVYRALVLGTRDYVRKNDFQKVVLGMSGGIDSALTAVIACDALGRENVSAISMPSEFSSKATMEDARKISENLGINFMEISIRKLTNAYRGIFEKSFGTGELGVAGENMQARVRGNILMAFSNKYGWLVLATGNKSEIATGYCTLYGDMAGGFAVIKDVPKTLVYKLAEYVNRKWGKCVIPRSIIKRAPSAELRPRQKDTDSLPPYDKLDPILRAYIEEDKNIESIVAAGLGKPEAVRRIIRMVDMNEYKRRQAPPGVRITPKAFGRDRRFPITNRYR